MWCRARTQAFPDPEAGCVDEPSIDSTTRHLAHARTPCGHHPGASGFSQHDGEPRRDHRRPTDHFRDALRSRIMESWRVQAQGRPTDDRDTASRGRCGRRGRSGGLRVEAKRRGDELRVERVDRLDEAGAADRAGRVAARVEDAGEDVAVTSGRTRIVRLGLPRGARSRRRGRQGRATTDRVSGRDGA
jgi:hypothetical protein